MDWVAKPNKPTNQLEHVEISCINSIRQLKGLDLIDFAEVTWQLHEKLTAFQHLCISVESRVLLYYDFSGQGFQCVSISTLSF